MSRLVYLDDNASNPIDPRVVESMMNVYQGGPANAASSHAAGRRASALVDEARNRVAALVGASPADVIFTSGATEANNLMIAGWEPQGGRSRVLISSVEHDSVREPAAARGDGSASCVSVNSDGVLDLDALDGLLNESTGLVSVVAANSETGVLNPVEAVARRVHERGGAFHTDATQWVGRLPFSLDSMGVDAISISGHKMCGPQGVGALIVRRALQKSLQPVIRGGGHERRLRSGSLNVAAIVGLGKAATLAADLADAERQSRLRDRLAAGLTTVGDLVVNGSIVFRLPNTLNVRFVGAPADAVLAQMPDVAASLGSACHAGAPEPSPVLLAMGRSREHASESIRFSVTRFTTESEIDTALIEITRAVARVRRLKREVA